MALDSEFRQNYAERKTAIRSIDRTALIPRQKRHVLSIADVGVKGVVRFNEKTYLVSGLSTYTEQDSKDIWFELTLFCLETGETLYLEWERDDEIEVFVSVRKLSFRDILDDGGERIDEEDLDEIVDQEDNVFFEGVAYMYEDDYSAIYKRNRVDRKKGDEVSFVDFYSKTTGLGLTVEGWKSAAGGIDYEIWLSKEMKPAAIEIIAVGDSK